MEMKEGTSIEKNLKNMKDLTEQLAMIGAPIDEEYQIVMLLGSLPKGDSIHLLLLYKLEIRSH